MKTLLFAAALALSGTAIAQTGNTVNDPAQSSGPRGVTQQGTDPNGEACTPAGFNAGSTGYPPCSGAMAGGTTGGAPSGSMAGGTTGGTMGGGALPACSKTVTDRCTQTYERGVRRR
ncbi:MAG TPA: hypothetical protein VGB48_05235 [Allosphingosinicella sp.]|jgi:hypothetical protein